MHTVVNTCFRFSGYTLDTVRGRLSAGDVEIPLRPKSFEVLDYLVRNADRLIPKDEIIEAIWPDVTVTDDSLKQCISEIRLALGDGEQRIIRTMPRRGYFFAAPVSSSLAGIRVNQEMPGEVKQRPLEEVAARPAGPFRRQASFRLAAAVVFTLLVLGAGAWVWLQPAGLQLPDRPSIAVLPFAGNGGDPQQQYFYDGVTDDLIVGLSKFSDLFVIARDSTFAYQGKRVEPKQIGRELGVRYLLQGSIRRDDDRLRITAQLVDAVTGRQRWAESYDGGYGRVFAVQDEVVQKIVRTLVSHITQSELDRGLRKPPESLAAYDYYLRANAAMRRREGENRGANVLSARELYEQSVALDPRFAPALQGLAYTYVTAWLEPPNRSSPLAHEWRQQDKIDLALSYAQKAVEMDPFLAEAHATLAWVLHWQYRRNEAVLAFERAFELNPDLADGRFVLVLYQTGRAAHSIELMKRIMRHDPFPPAVYLSYLGNAYYLNGQYELALESTRASAKRLPGYQASFIWYAASAAQLGRMDEAREAAAEVLKIRPGFTITWFLGQIRLAKPEDAERLRAGLLKAGLPR